MSTVALTKENFGDIVNGNDIVVVDFWAPWCGPCQSFGPIYEEMSERFTDVVFGKVNTEEERELAGHFQIRSIPTLMIMREQVILFSQPGALPGSALQDIIQQAKAVDMAEVHRQIADEQGQQDA